MGNSTRLTQGTPNGYSLYEFAVYAENTIFTHPESYVNVALNKPTAVSSTENSSLVGANAVDSSATTRWSTVYRDPQWISVDLGDNYPISEISLTWEAALGKNYQLQVSSDNVSWTTVTDVVGNSVAGLHEYPLDTPVTARYVRMYGTARGTSYGYSLYDFAVYVDEPDTAPAPVLSNVALNKAVTVTSTENSGTAGSFAVDGDTTTRWSSNWTDNQAITVDLGANYTIFEVDLDWEAAYGREYSIQTNSDGNTWTTRAGAGSNNVAGWHYYPLAAPVSARFVRMQGAIRGTQYGYSLYEFAVLSDGTTTTSPPLVTNLALNGTATASSVEATVFSAANAIDGDETTRWSSLYQPNQWFQVDLGSVHNITEVDIDWEAAFGKDYLIQVSNDGVNWNTQISVQGNTTAGWHYHPISTPVSARYVRMQGVTRGTQYGYSMYEMKVLGN